MKYFIILLLCLNLTAIGSSKENKTGQKKEQSKPVLSSKTIDQDVNALKLDLSAIYYSLQKTNEKVNFLSDSLKSTNNRIKHFEENLNGKRESSNSLAIAFFIVTLFLLLIMTVIFYFIYTRLKTEIKKHNHIINTPKGSIIQENKELNKVQNDINMIRQDFRQMQNSIEKIQREKNTIVQEEKQFSVYNPTIDISEPKEAKVEEFFMSTPNDDGSFNQSNSSQFFRPTASFYRFIINNSNNTKANFFFVDDEWAVATASDFPQTYIDPVCEAVNAVNNHSKRIVTLHQGIVEKSGDKWVLIKKASIRYE